jgi:hypothetical protein
MAPTHQLFQRHTSNSNAGKDKPELMIAQLLSMRDPQAPDAKYTRCGGSQN